MKFLLSGAALALLLSKPVLALEAIEDPERLPGNEESYVALAIVVTSILMAWFLNHRAQGVRVAGTLLAALGCLGIAGWFGLFVLDTGFLENPKPHQTPLDAAKPVLLWLQAGVAFIVGLGLLLVAKAQVGHERQLDLPAKNEAARYGLISRMLHWTTASLIIVLIPMGIFTSMIPEGTAWRTEFYVVHKTIGVLTFVLLLMRLVWNRMSTRPALDKSLKPVERKMAHGAHIALYVLMIAMPVTGFIMTTFHGAPTFFFAWELDPLWGYSETGTIFWGMLHKYLLPYVLYIILGAHILGALKHRFLDGHKESLRRMVS